MKVTCWDMLVNTWVRPHAGIRYIQGEGCGQAGIGYNRIQGGEQIGTCWVSGTVRGLELVTV